MKILYPVITKYIKTSLSNQGEAELKEVVLKQVIKDSRKLCTLLIIINYSLLAVAVASAFFLYSALLVYGVSQELALFSSATFILSCAGITLLVSAKKLQQRLKLYQNIQTIKKNTRPDTLRLVFSPLIQELKSEQSKMADYRN